MAKGRLKDGRTWTVDGGGISTLKRDYIVVLDAVTAENGEETSFPGVPAIGTAHPRYSGLYATTYDVEEGQGAAKNTLKVTVSYKPRTYEVTTLPGEEEGGVEVSSLVESWGWDAGTEERELVDATDGTAVLNSAGDVFESVPTVSVSAPTFTKVMRFQARQAGAMDCDCKVNESAITIGGREYPAGSLRCHVAEQRIFGDATWNYRYTVQLKYRSNPVRLEGGGNVTDIGWDVAITDAGMREFRDGGLRLIKAVDPETGKKCTVTSPELLDGQGRAVSRESEQIPTPYNMRFEAYERVSIPDWFYSEPPIVNVEEEE